MERTFDHALFLYLPVPVQCGRLFITLHFFLCTDAYVENPPPLSQHFDRHSNASIIPSLSGAASASDATTKPFKGQPRVSSAASTSSAAVFANALGLKSAPTTTAPKGLSGANPQKADVNSHIGAGSTTAAAPSSSSSSISLDAAEALTSLAAASNNARVGDVLARMGTFFVFSLVTQNP